MKPYRFACSTITAFGLAAFAHAAFAEMAQAPETALPPAKDSPTAAAPALAPDLWSALKGSTYDQRDALFAGLQPLLSKVDDQISELTAKRAVMNNGAIDTKDWDFAMKEMNNARSYLAGMAEELTQTTRENWGQQKDRFGQAWVRTQDAYGKVKASTTN
jgi:hypothetical protein